jgi:dephospho-CoA kinase
VRKVALTGGIATGKSYVLDRFRARGVSCLDADELAHGVMQAGTHAAAAIAERFGPDMLRADGSVDRGKLGKIVFADPVARKDLEALTHPAVYRAIAAGFRAFELTDHPSFAVAAIPLLYETGHASDFDRVIVTTCAPETQVARLLARGMNEADARRRLAAQMPTEDKAKRANFVIRTDGAFADTDAQADAVLNALVPGS